MTEETIAPSPKEVKALATLEAQTDPVKVRKLMENAQREGSLLVAKAAFRRLVDLLPQEEPGTLEHHF
ncbi:MAG: hypothetical protein ACFBWO_09255 [Paracoccaceae bacterium]